MSSSSKSITLPHRLLGRYQGEKNGPMLIVVGGLHGNETAGVKAIEKVFEMLSKEKEKNPGFVFTGEIVGIIGNRRALAQGKRFIDKDLNRQFSAAHIEEILRTPVADLCSEDLEILELRAFFENEILAWSPSQLFVLDIHTTSAHGGVFSVSSDDPESIEIALSLHVPVVTGMLDGIQGTLLHFFNRKYQPYHVVTVAFEAGNHTEPLSVDRSIAAIINCLRTIGCVNAEDVENRHDLILQAYLEGRPKLVDLHYVHSIQVEDAFEMRPGYKNFDAIRKGEWLANDKNGKVISPDDGFILMPLYQPQGEDGFFIVKNKG